MNGEEFDVCLKSFYTSTRKQDGQLYKSSSLKAIRAAIDRYLHMPPHSKQFSIIADPAFTEANKVLDAFVKELRKSGKISGVVHKKAISKQQVEKLFQSGELGLADTKDPAQLQRTAWFYLGIYFRRCGLLQEDEKPSKWPFQCRRWVGCKNICCARICQMLGENHKKLLVPFES